MNCQFFDNGKCLLGFHNSTPNEGNCRSCINAGENNNEFAERLEKSRATILSNPSTFAKKIQSLVGDVKTWAASGMPISKPSAFSQRIEICKACEFWNPKGFKGTGSCSKCGCSTQAKLRMATSKCPIDKWGPIV